MKYSPKDNLYYLTADDSFEGYPFKAFRVVNREYDQPMHCHNYMQIWYMKSGECLHVFDGEEYKLTKGNIFILPPDVPHKIVSTDAKNNDLYGCEFIESFICDTKDGEMSFDFNYIKPFLVSKDKIRPVFILDGASIKLIEGLFENIVFEYQQKRAFFELHIKADILKMLSIIAREYSKNAEETKKNVLNKHTRAMTEAINYINKNYTEKIYLGDVCKIALMSPTYFSFLFKQTTGRSFTNHLNYLRVLKAKELLADNNKSVSGIALEVGFSDPAYFDRVFKKETGISPGKFRKFL